MKWDPLDTEGEPLRLAMIDDHELVLSGLVHMLAEFPRYEITLTLTDARLLDLEMPLSERPHIAIVEMSMPHMDGEQTIRTMRLHWPQTRILGVSFDATAAVVRKALDAGACGFLDKNVRKASLHEALEHVQRRGYYHNEELYSTFLADGSMDPKKVLELCLTKRERQVLDCACWPDEPTWKMVADRLSMSEDTVDTHRGNLFKKLNVKSKAGAVSYGQQHGYGQGIYWKTTN